MSVAGVVAACTEQKPVELGGAPPSPTIGPDSDASTDPPPVEETDAPITPPKSSVAFVPVSTGVLSKPIEISARAGRIYVAEQTGKIRRLGADGATDDVALDIASRVTNGYDQGLLGFTFHPNFPATPYLYVSYTAPHPDVPPPENVSFQSVVARYESVDGGLTFDDDTEKRLLVWDHPGVNHNNNSLVFGPDGLLYIASGDGSDPLDRRYSQSQDTNNLFAAILRIDVDNGDPYSIPPSNPFAAGGGRPEIYAYGLRNVWRFDFDGKSGRLFAGDVGHLDWEEINEVFPGANYGWAAREGMFCFDAGPGCDGTFVDPLIVHDHTEANSIVGGVVYHGTKIPHLTGKYVYCDAGSGYFWAASMDSPKPTPVRIHETPRMRAVTIRLDEDGEILVAQYAAGRVLRMTLPTD
ncbi:MAG: PQQ-dependent sugar dehydrogenase [Labilithrix sp.]|nr:PQQ-dependent sugar dehydrogenase [Labilithrix sp.]